MKELLTSACNTVATTTIYIYYKCMIYWIYQVSLCSTGNTTWTLLGTSYYSFVLNIWGKALIWGLTELNTVFFLSLFHFIVCISHPVSSSLSPCCFLLCFSLFSFVIYYLIALSIFSHIFSTLLLFLFIFWFILHFFPNFSVSFSFLLN